MREQSWRLKLIFPNLVYQSALSGGAWETGDLSLDALHDPVMGRVARSRSASADDAQIVIALDRTRRVGGLAIFNHNLSPAAQIVVQAFHNEALTDVAYNDEAAPVAVYPPIYTNGDVPFGEPNWWSRKPLAEDIGRVTTIALLLLPDDVNARHWRIRILDEGNPAGRIDIGKVVLGPVFDPPCNYSLGASLTITDESRMSQSIGGTRYFDERGKRRAFAFGFEAMDEARNFGRVFDLVADAGITRELVVIPDPSDIVNLHRRSFCGRLRAGTALEQAYLRRFNAQFVAEEDI